MISYLNNKKYFGAFWGLYFVGVHSIKDFKYTIFEIISSFIIGVVITYEIKSIILTIDSVSHEQLLQSLITLCIGKIMRSYISCSADKATHEERIVICSRIANYMNTLYMKANFTWKENHTESEQHESINAVFFQYSNMTSSIMGLIRVFIDTTSVICVAFNDSPIVIIIVTIGTCLLYYVHKYFNKSSNELNAMVGEKSKRYSNKTSIQYTNRSDVLYNPEFSKLSLLYNPVVGIIDSFSLWTTQYQLQKKSTEITYSVQNVINIMFTIYLWYISKIGLISFMVVNGERLFGYVELYMSINSTWVLAGSRMAITFSMLDELNEMTSSSELKLTKCNHILISSIKKTISESVSLEYKGDINIYLNEGGIIHLNGKKGCGKSVTMGILAGQYDGQVCSKMIIDNVVVPDEFRALEPIRTYVRQCIADSYRNNMSSTIVMTLSELFPGVKSMVKIQNYLTHFDLVHKMPKDLTSSISTSEHGLSPGEIQSFVLASQIWKAIELKSELLLLDEPERNIDFESIKKIFDFITEKYHGTIVLVTHLQDLKKYLHRKKCIKQTWEYPPNTGGSRLTFTITHH